MPDHFECLKTLIALDVGPETRASSRRMYLIYAGEHPQGIEYVISSISNGILSSRGYELAEWSSVVVRRETHIAINIAGRESERFRPRIREMFVVDSITPAVYSIRNHEHWLLICSAHKTRGGTNNKSHGQKSTKIADVRALVARGLSDLEIEERLALKAVDRVLITRVRREEEFNSERARALGMSEALQESARIRYQRALLEIEAHGVVCWLGTSIDPEEYAIFASGLSARGEALVLHSIVPREIDSAATAWRARHGEPRVIVFEMQARMAPPPRSEAILELCRTAEALRDGRTWPGKRPAVFIIADYYPTVTAASGINLERWMICLPTSVEGAGQVLCGAAAAGMANEAMVRTGEEVPLLDYPAVVRAIELGARDPVPISGDDPLERAFKSCWCSFQPEILARFWWLGYDPQLVFESFERTCVSSMNPGAPIKTVGATLSVIPVQLSPERAARVREWLQRRQYNSDMKLADINRSRERYGQPPLAAIPAPRIPTRPPTPPRLSAEAPEDPGRWSPDPSMSPTDGIAPYSLSWIIYVSAPSTNDAKSHIASLTEYAEQNELRPNENPIRIEICSHTTPSNLRPVLCTLAQMEHIGILCVHPSQIAESPTDYVKFAALHPNLVLRFINE